MKAEQLRRGAEVAIAESKKAMSGGIDVGGAIYFQGDWVGGFNIELDNDTSRHAEVVALVRVLDRGGRWDDIKTYVEFYQDPTHNKVEIFPQCPDCWKWYKALVSPKMKIEVVDKVGNVHYECKLGDISPPAPGVTYPSDLLRKLRPLHNFTPLGNRPQLQTEFWLKGPNDAGTPIKVALEYTKRGIVFDAVPQALFAGVSFTMRDGRVFGGFRVQTHVFDGSLNATNTGGILAAVEGYHGKDFKSMICVVPNYVPPKEVVGFLGSAMGEWGNVLDFAHSKIHITAVNGKGGVMYDGTLRDIYSKFGRTGEFYKTLRLLRSRSNSEPKLADVAAYGYYAVSKNGAERVSRALKSVAS